MGGRIWLTSVPGQGSRFRFVAPFGVQPASSESTRGSLDAIRVLVVDDHATNRFILQELLGSWRMPRMRPKARRRP